MIKLLSVLVVAVLMGISKASYCEDNQTLSDLPEGVAPEVVSILATGTVSVIAGCPTNNPIDPNDVKFWFNNRANPDEPILLDPTNPVQVDPTKPTKILIHGWLCNITDDRMPQLKDAYLQRYDCNVIRVEWTTLAIALYTSSFCSLPGVSEIIGAFVCTLNSVQNVQMSDLHLVGHSMGGQACGLTGQEVMSQCGLTVGRITGLDPAGPMYQTLSTSQRLDATDAQKVDVIHTNAGGAGFFGPCGDVDFYPNCGSAQPGCTTVDLSNIAAIMNIPFSTLNCAHLRSGSYMVESINPGVNDFNAASCATCPVGVCVKDLFFVRKYNVMGEDCTNPSPASNFYLTTNAQSPYAQG